MSIAAGIEIAELAADRMTGGRAGEPGACFACGRSYSRGDGRFCSTQCRSAYDAGFPAYALPSPVRYTLDGRPMPIMGDGFAIQCAGCNRTFSSRGLRCCSTTCERKYREREDNLATMAEVGIEPSLKRRCQAEGCDATIPKYRGVGKARRLVRSDVKFCSPKCARKAGKMDQEPKPDFDAIEAKKCLQIGGS